MNRKTKLVAIFSGIVLVLVIAAAVRGVAEKPSSATKLPEIPAGEYDPAYWGKFYPLEYKSYLKNLETSPSPTGYGGSINFQHSTKEPEILVNFKGMAFSKDYSEDRGHPYALRDFRESKRITPQSPGACMTCKTANLIDIYKDMGGSYAKKPMGEMFPKMKHGITCANCHDPATMGLRVVNPAFIEAMQSRGVDVKKAPREQMRSYVCGQCHSEYYFEPGTTRVVFPWAKGLQPDRMYALYGTNPGGFTQDWIHPDSGAKMLKAQHPDFETWSTGTHGAAGASCADCHMPSMKEGDKRYSSHWVTSPMRNVEASCRPCHEQSTEWLSERVKATQDTTWLLQRTAGQLVARAHEAIGKAVATGKADPAELEKARELVRKAQWYWDFVAAENGMGFHNPVQALGVLGQSIDLAHQAIARANRAAGTNF
jgi:nitrite reductase (cytochrome c-552)